MENMGLKEVIGKLECLYSKFNDHFYEGKLEAPVITVSPDVTKGAYGWCTSWKAWKEGEESEGRYEINMCAEHLNRPFDQTCGTLLHEMVHLWNLQNDIQDTSRGGMYHNKKFKDVAETHGLMIEKSEKYGWTITHLNEEGKRYIEGMKEQGFNLYRESNSFMKKSSSSSSSRKYVCPTCGSIIRATKEVNIICGDCHCEFEEEI